LALSWGGQESITLNIGSGEKCTILDLARLMCEVMGFPEAWHYTGQYRAGDIRSCFAETRSATRELGFASAVDLREGMMDLVAWVANSGFHADHYDESVQILEARVCSLDRTTGSRTGISN
jgi:dTDP-L-rhamnose 4-epimerase